MICQLAWTRKPNQEPTPRTPSSFKRRHTSEFPEKCWTSSTRVLQGSKFYSQRHQKWCIAKYCSTKETSSQKFFHYIHIFLSIFLLVPRFYPLLIAFSFSDADGSLGLPKQYYQSLFYRWVVRSVSSVVRRSSNSSHLLCCGNFFICHHIHVEVDLFEKSPRVLLQNLL